MECGVRVRGRDEDKWKSDSSLALKLRAERCKATETNQVED